MKGTPFLDYRPRHRGSLNALHPGASRRACARPPPLAPATTSSRKPQVRALLRLGNRDLTLSEAFGWAQLGQLAHFS